MLDIVGDGPLFDQVAAYVAQHQLEGRVRQHGRLPHPDTLRLIRSADVLLYHAVTSPIDGDAEGQPLVVLEAMAAGAAVVATDHAGIPEVLADQVNGRLVAEHDVAGMTRALLELAADPAERRRLGDAAHATVAENHRSENARGTLLRLLGLTDTTAHSVERR